MTRRLNPFRYLAVQVRDVARLQGIFFAVVSFGLVIIMHRAMRTMVTGTTDVAELLRTTVTATIMVATLMVSGGIAGVDRKQGYYRALFSQPMAPWWYYLQRWLVGWATVLTIPLWLWLAFRLVFGMGGGLSLQLFASLSLAYLLIGGAVLLVSTIAARDWLIVFLIYFTQRQLDNVATMIDRAGGEVPRAVSVALDILPPFGAITEMSALPSGAMLWRVVGYGVGMVALALLLFRIRPLGSGGRA